MTENFANAPVSITEIRSDRTQKAEDWTPRDCLIALLRQIDQKELEPLGVYVIVTSKNTNDGYTVHRSTAGPHSELELRGLIAGELTRRSLDTA